MLIDCIKLGICQEKNGELSYKNELFDQHYAFEEKLFWQNGQKYSIKDLKNKELSKVFKCRERLVRI
jgi:hypothetical protein